MVQRCTSAWSPNTRRTAAANALTPSITTSSPLASNPRATSSASSDRTTVAFSVSPRQHAFEHHPVELIIGRERGIRRQLHLAAIGRAGARPAHRDPVAAQHPRPGSARVPHRRAVGQPRVLRADRDGDLVVHQRPVERRL
jgi:hypothetical protein